MATSRDVQEIVSKLSSDKAKARDEGIKLLNTWLEGERSIAFCKFLGQHTANLRPDEIPHSETWPFLVTLLIRCTSSEISSSKRRSPKLIYAKTLRIVVQRAEDAKFSGKMLPLLSAVKSLSNHIWDVLSNVPSFQSEYGVILRHLLAVRDYRFHMRKRIYCNLVLLYMEKVETSLGEKIDGQYNPKEEVFRCILTLQSLLENPPGDFPNTFRDDIIKGFVGIFSYIRDEGKISRKLIECVNTFLLKDGPNLGNQFLEIHNSVQQFVFRCWLTTHDRALKDALVLYARLQLNLTRGGADAGSLVDQLLDVICKDLDQSNISSTGVPWSDATKDDKFGTLNNSQCGLVELAAVVFYRACIGTAKAPSTQKRLKREHASAHLKEALMKGKWLWNAAFCYLTHNYNNRISKNLLVYWFKGICSNFERILNDANMGHDYDGLLWTLRSLQELSSVLLLPDSKGWISSISSSTLSEFDCSWQLIWSCLMHGLPMFSSVTAVVDAALVLLGNIISYDLTNKYIIPQDIWDLRLFKRMPSVSVLYFISCYFSRKGSQGDIRDILNLRKNLLRAVLGHANWKEPSILNERVVLFLPAAVYALCAGCAPFKQCYNGFPLSYSFVDDTEAALEQVKIEDFEHDSLHEVFECSVEVLARIDQDCGVEVSPLQSHQGVRLPRQLRDQLLQEMETYILGSLVDKEIEKSPISDIFFRCALFSNFIYGSCFTRKSEEVSPFLSEMGKCLLELLDHALSVIQGNYTNFRSLSCLGSDSFFGGTNALVASLQSFICCPIFMKWRDRDDLDVFLYGSVMQSMERLLHALVKLYEEYSECVRNFRSENILQDLSVFDNSVQNSFASDGNKSRIMDMELDVNEDSRDVDILTVGGKIATGISFSSEKWKFSIISVISSFFSVLPVVTWDILFELMGKESDQKVCEKILYNLCQHPYWSSSAKITDLVNIFSDMIEMQVSLKLNCVNILAAMHGLLAALLSMVTVRKDKYAGPSFGGKDSKQRLTHLGDLVNKVADLDLLDWFGRVKLIDCTCNFVLLCPQIGQTMIEGLLMLLRDPDYRVRFFLARRIGVLFQTWDGHKELFQDICSNFGVTLVVSSKEKLVTAREVLAAGPQPQPVLETVIITLMHIAFYSEKVELEAVFMMCAVAAIDPCQRELVNAVLHNLSRQLKYTSMLKYLEELMGSIIFCWVACGVSLVALVEIRQLFVSDAEPSYFVQYCCHWLLPALVLHGDSSNLSWVAKVACQPLEVLVKSHFVPIFAICMALHCSKKSGWEKGAVVLQSSILHLAEISESERDKLIKKHMVSIVSHILSLASCASDPPVPLFSRDTIVHAVQTVVDGFLEMEDNPITAGVVDKINIFRPDRVFMFIVEMHYKIAAAVHHRHKCHRLAGIEVLINILGHRAAVSSTSNYLFNLIGQFINSHALQDQCCGIISALLRTFKSNPSEEMISVLGEQLQFLVSKLVACCIPSESNGEDSGTRLSQVLSLLLQLTVDSDPAFYDYIRELEPFPEIDIFDKIRKFHQELCHAYSPRDHLLKFVKRSSYLPPRLLLWSLQALHKKLLMGETCQSGKNSEDLVTDRYWNGDHEIVHAVWTLVRMCGSDDAGSVRALASDFISRVGIGDPHCVVFHLPGDSSHVHVCQPINHDNATGINFRMVTGISDELLMAILKLLKKYLMDDSVKIIDMTSQALRGILSTESGQRALMSFDSYERSLIEVHSKGININLVEKFLLDLERKFKAEAISLEKSTVWVTQGKTFEMWICPLVYALIGYCNDVILRLCQEIVLLKAEVAELLLPTVIVNLAGRKDLEAGLHKTISLQLQEHIFTESNKLIKSIQVFLNALNELRLCHVMERSSLPSKRESSKLISQIITFEHEGNWSKALEYYDLQVRSDASLQMDGSSRYLSSEETQPTNHLSVSKLEDEITHRKPYKGLIRSLQQIGCMHVLDLYCQGLTSRKGQFQHDLEFAELQLLALANGDRIKDKQSSRNSFVVDLDKKIAAENLLKELSSYHGAIIVQMKQMVEIYIKLAELETRREDTNKRITLPREIRSLRQLELVPVVTATFPVDRSCQYHEGSFPYFKGLADSVMVMNGINAPKVVECLGSDGRRYRQLAKSGNDDLRQDAVMEQFFGLVNTFLQNHRDTWKRRLGVRTYKVVPFTPSAGVLEWVDGTLPLGDYLIGSNRNGGAHGRYGLGDWSFLRCREHMANEKDKCKAFHAVSENFRPVMHYFFLERFLQPADWFEKRLAYTRSVAASSMVGYIVGLGDRHSMNILIDQVSAEVVHIDLGVAFEQGLMLKTPERVPFRLTRDIIDGMGVTGVEGVFRRCCEETLSVMRTNKEALLTIVEVFIHDPLYKWALSPLKALQRQKETDDDIETILEDSQDECEGNKDATRALMRVKQKLDGYEEGEMRSVRGQVQQLIQDAIDPERLCHMYPGWGAWL
ncbi:hypothetical protein SO802_020455 [Lithocarpus litseifolius]|uniref:Serine/threonine-protein kinase ATM n=1 Tax=Lithocarpus litseifolius TaxID=425828 RepID=A0AAW2CC16_9ROSI